MNRSEKSYILSIESSNAVCSVALGNSDHLLGEYTLRIRNIHNERLGVFIHELLREHQLTMQEIGYIALSAGPGSYTGLRIGFSLAKGIAYPDSIPVVALPSLEISAYKSRFIGNPIVSVINAHRQELYVCDYTWKDGRLISNSVVSIATINQFRKKWMNDNITLTGSAVPVVLSFLDEKELPSHWHIASEDFWYTTGKDIYHYFMHVKNHQLLKEYNLEEPLYVRDFKGTY